MKQDNTNTIIAAVLGVGAAILFALKWKEIKALFQKKGFDSDAKTDSDKIVIPPQFGYNGNDDVTKVDDVDLERYKNEVFNKVEDAIKDCRTAREWHFYVPMASFQKKKNNSDVTPDYEKMKEKALVSIWEDVKRVFGQDDLMPSSELILGCQVFLTDNNAVRNILEVKFKNFDIDYKLYCFSRKSAYFFDRDEYARQNKK